MSNVLGTVEFDVRLNLDQFNKEIARIKNYIYHVFLFVLTFLMILRKKLRKKTKKSLFHLSLKKRYHHRMLKKKKERQIILPGKINQKNKQLKKRIREKKMSFFLGKGEMEEPEINMADLFRHRVPLR